MCESKHSSVLCARGWGSRAKATGGIPWECGAGMWRGVRLPVWLGRASRDKALLLFGP